MPKIAYEEWSPRPAALALVEAANKIIAEYQAQGFDLTLRQLYYQFVSRDLIPNKQSEYKRLGDIISRARRAGLIDWSAIVDRTRYLRSIDSWDSPQQILDAVAKQFRFNPWAHQPRQIEVWFEKDALLGVFERPANARRIPFFSCRGYVSDSEVWGAAQRLIDLDKPTLILHFGDHDPSGIDMTRDIEDRLRLFGAYNVEVRRIALTFDQVQEYGPPPNPAKETDSRFGSYRSMFGDESWELDALDPTTLAAMVEGEAVEVIDQEAWSKSMAEESIQRDRLQLLSLHYEDVIKSIGRTGAGAKTPKRTR